MDELARGVEALAAVADEAGGIGLGVEVQEERAIHDSQAAMEYVKTVLQFNCVKEKK